MLIDTDNHQFTLYHHTGRKYVSVKPRASGRRVLPELDLEIGLQDDSVRYWYQGELLLLPAELLREIERKRGEIENHRRIAAKAKQRAKEAKQARIALERKQKRLRGKWNRAQKESEGQ